MRRSSDESAAVDFGGAELAAPFVSAAFARPELRRCVRGTEVVWERAMGAGPDGDDGFEMWVQVSVRFFFFVGRCWSQLGFPLKKMLEKCPFKAETFLVLLIHANTAAVFIRLSTCSGVIHIFDQFYKHATQIHQWEKLESFIHWLMTTAAECDADDRIIVASGDQPPASSISCSCFLFAISAKLYFFAHLLFCVPIWLHDVQDQHCFHWARV